MAPKAFIKQTLLAMCTLHLRAVSFLSTALLLSACSGGLDSWGGFDLGSQSTASTKSSEVSADRQEVSITSGPVVKYVLTAKPGDRKYVSDPAFGGNVYVIKGADYFSASGRKCARFTVKQMSIMNKISKDRNEQNVLCSKDGTIVIHQPIN